jgi:hypothetical protein
MMTPQEKANELVNKYWKINTENDYWTVSLSLGKRMAIIAVDYIITSNPHSNPFNTDVHSTMAYWMNVKKEIQKL